MAKKTTKKVAKAKDLPTKSLTAKQARQVVGGKAGNGQKEYLIVKMNDVIVT